MKRRYTITVILAVILSLTLTTVTAGAESLSDIREKITDNENKLSEGKKKSESLSTQLNELEYSIALNEDKLIVLEGELEEAEKKVGKQTENLNGRLRNMYKNGSVGFLDVLLNSGSFTEFLSNLDMVQIIYASDKDTLDKLEDAHNEVETKKKEVETLQGELKESKAVVEKEKAAIDASNEETEKMIDELQADADRITRELQSQGSSSSTSTYLGGEMAWPTPSSGIVTSPFGWRKHPIFGYNKFHTGIDIGASSGSAIVAANDGKVISAGWNGGYGNCVIVDHGGGVTTLYAHCSSLAVGGGQSVSRGQTIAYVGSTGNSTGPHLHFEVRINGGYVNPYPYVT